MGKFQPPRAQKLRNGFQWTLEYTTMSGVMTTHANPYGAATTWVVSANMWPVTCCGFLVYLSFFIWLEARLQPNTGNSKYFTVRFHSVHAFGYNSAGSEPIWMKFGALWEHCLLLAVADFAHDPRRSNSEASFCFFLQRVQCSHCKRCISYSNSVCRPSVTRRYCVKTTARSTVQLALLDSKMCLVL